MRTVYVIGVPGAGKSSAVAGAIALAGYRPVLTENKPVPHVRYASPRSTAQQAEGQLWQVGKVRESFSGSDALGMAINPQAIEWVTELCCIGPGESSAPRVLVGEGDRLANRSFLAACPELTLVHIDVPLPVARLRASMRARDLGVPEQSESWWKGRATKVANLWRDVPSLSPHSMVRINGNARPEQVAAALAEVLS